MNKTANYIKSQQVVLHYIDSNKIENEIILEKGKSYELTLKVNFEGVSNSTDLYFKIMDTFNNKTYRIPINCIKMIKDTEEL